MQDLKNNIKVQAALNIAAITSNTTTNGSSVDLLGYNSATFVISSGARTDGTFTPLVVDSDDNSTFTAVDDKFLIGLESEAVISAANTLRKIGYVGQKRYIRLSIVSTSVTSGATLGASAILSHPNTAPVA
jgi:hypothetical protein